MRLTNDKNPPNCNFTAKVKWELSGNPKEAEEIDLREDENFYMLAMVDMTQQDPAAHYNSKLASLKEGRDHPCSMKFLADGISEEYVKLMRGLQFLDSEVNADTLIGLARSIRQDEMWVRSSLNTHTPLEAAISAGFTEFGSEIADNIAKVLISRGAPLIRHTMDYVKSGGPTSSPVHMLMSRGQFGRLNDLLQIAKNVGRLDGDKEPDAVNLLSGSTPEDPELYSPLWHCVHSGMSLKFLQSPFCRDKLNELCVPPESADTFRAKFASYALRAAALGVIARDPEDFARLFEDQSKVNPIGAVAGLPIHRAIEGGAKRALPVAHAKKLIELLDTKTILAYDAAGRTVLHAAVCAGNAPIVDALLEKFPILANLQTRPLRFDPFPSGQANIDDQELSKSKQTRSQLFEKMRQEAVQCASKKWGADSTDPSTFRTACVPPGKYPLEFASEHHDVNVVERMVSSLATKSDIPDHEVIDRCLANIVSKKVSSQTFSLLLNLCSEVPRSAVAEGVLRRNKDFLRAAFYKFGSLNVVLDKPEAYWEPATALIDQWKKNASPGRAATRSGLRELIKCANTSVEGSSDESLHKKCYSGIGVTTPMVLAIQNNFDIEMVQFVQAECGCSAGASFLEPLMKEKKIQLEQAEMCNDDRTGNLAKRCDPFHVFIVIRESFAAGPESINRAVQLIDFLVGRGVFLGDQNLQMKEFLVNAFLSSLLPKSQDQSFPGRFINQYLQLSPEMSIPGNDNKNAFALNRNTVSHLTLIGFKQWHILPIESFKRFLAIISTSTDFPKLDNNNNNDDENPEEENNNNNNNNTDRFLAMNQEGPDAFDPWGDKGNHPIMDLLYLRYRLNNFYRSIPSGFSTNIGPDTINSAYPYGIIASAEVDSLVGRSCFVKFLVDNFWKESSSVGERGEILNFCMMVQSVAATCNQENDSNLRTLDYLVDRASATGVKLAVFTRESFLHVKSVFKNYPYEREVPRVLAFLNTFAESIVKSVPNTNSFNSIKYDPIRTNFTLIKALGLTNFAQSSSFVDGILSNGIFSNSKFPGKQQTFRDYLLLELLFAGLHRGGDFDKNLLQRSEIINAKPVSSGNADEDRSVLLWFLSQKMVLGKNYFEESFNTAFPDVDLSKIIEQHVFRFCGQDENVSAKDNKIVLVAKSARGDWFDNWIAQELKSFFSASSSSSSSSTLEDPTNWYGLQSFLFVIANAGRTKSYAQTALNPIFNVLINSSLDALGKININLQARLYAVLVTATIGSDLEFTVRELARVRESSVLVASDDDADGSALRNRIEQEFEVVKKAIEEEDKKKNAGVNGLEEAEEGEYNNNNYDQQGNDSSFVFTWDECCESLINRSGDIELARLLFVVIGQDGPFRGLRSSRLGGIPFVQAFVRTWGERLNEGNQPLDMKLVDFLFKGASYSVQSKILQHLVNGGPYFNEDVFKGRALATFLFEKLVALGRQADSKALIDVLDLGTRFADDPSAFIDAYGEEVDTALRDQVAGGNPRAIEVCKRLSGPLMKTEFFQDRGPFSILDAIFYYDSDLRDVPEGLFKPMYDMEKIEREGEEDEDNNNNNNYFGERLPNTSPTPYDRFLYLIFRNKQQQQQPRLSPSELEEFLQFTLIPKDIKKCLNLTIAPSVCSNSILQNSVFAAKVAIPRAVNVIFGEVNISWSRDRLAKVLELSGELVTVLATGDARLEISTSSNFSGWAMVEIQNESYVIKVRPDALQQNPVPEEVSLSPELQRIYDYINQPKLFNEDV